MRETRQNRAEFFLNRGEDTFVVANQIHFVDGDHDAFDAQQACDVGMTARLRQHAFARVHQHDGQFRGRCAGDHIARVLFMAGSIGNDELAAWCSEVAIGNIDRDALLAFGTQTIGQ